MDSTRTNQQSRKEVLMAASGPRDVWRFLASLLALGALVVGFPVALVMLSQGRFDSGNPLAGVTWPWQWSISGISDSLTRPLADDNVIDVLVRLSLSVIWVATIVIVVSTAVELAHMMRHRGIAVPSVRGLGWAQSAARFIAVGLLVVIPMMSPKAAISSGSDVSTPLRSPIVTPTE
ncbi:MAG: hypothetical protein DRJ50_10975, partial [Actinobacteria bacterium]